MSSRRRLEKCPTSIIDIQTGLLNLSSEAIYAWDLYGTIIYWNNGAEKIYGYSRKEAVGCVSHELLKTEQLKVDDIVLILARDGVWNGEILNTCKDGKKLIIETTQKVIINDEQRIVLEVNRDVTKFKTIENNLKEINNRLSLDLTANKELLVQSEKDNDALIQDNGTLIKDNDALIKDNGTLIQDNDALIKDNGTLIKDNGTLIQDNDALKKDNGTLKKDNSALKKDNGALKKDKDSLEKDLVLKDEFLSLISHEFKTPLTVINSAIQAMELLCKDELSPKAKGYIKNIRQNTYRQLRLVNNLLDITKLSAGRMKINKIDSDIVFLTKSITESVYTYAFHKGIRLTFTSSINKKIIGIDEEKFERILLNLLSNAIKFTPSGKNILVTVSTMKGYVQIKVKDEGIGIPKDKQELIFERFGQVESSLSRQAEGSGIGLSLVKKFVEALGGKITILSKEKIGSIFTVFLIDKKIQADSQEKVLQEISDNRLIQSIAIEFSDIYF